MPNKKLTDSEIVKALECCVKPTSDCNNCPCCDIRDVENCFDYTKREAIDLINRLQAEKDKAWEIFKKRTDENTELQMLCDKQKANIERLKNKPTLPKSGFINLLCGAVIYTETLEQYNKFRRTFKTKAYKEFAENIKGEIENVINNIRRKKKQHKSNISKIPLFDDNDIFYAKHNGKEEVLEDIRKYIDNLLKERVGENDA